MKTIHLFLLLLIATNAFGQENLQKYGYPMKDGKITYEGEVPSVGTKEQIFKRALQFIAIQNFDRIAEITTHTGTQRNVQLVKDAITYQDVEAGKIFGNGFYPFSYRGHNYFVLTFTYRLQVKDGKCKYIFTDFVVKELWDAGGGTVDRQFGRRTGTFTEAAKTKNFPLESFVDKSAYRKSHPYFISATNKLKADLKVALEDRL